MTRRVRIKFCGLTRIEDVDAAVALGVDAIGLVFVPQSRRCVSINQAAQLVARIPPFVSSVGLFMDASEAAVLDVLGSVRLDLLQFHGRESAADCERYALPYVKALAMGDGLDVEYEMTRYARARGVLLDAHRSGAQGGTGERFDWSAIPVAVAHRIILAGGLTPANVAEAVRSVRPYAVDVSSGIESAPGVKSERLMQEFIDEVDRASGEARPA